MLEGSCDDGNLIGLSIKLSIIQVLEARVRFFPMGLFQCDFCVHTLLSQAVCETTLPDCHRPMSVTTTHSGASRVVHAPPYTVEGVVTAAVNWVLCPPGHIVLHAWKQWIRIRIIWNLLSAFAHYLQVSRSRACIIHAVG